MSNVAFLVDPHFAGTHTGVRNYAFALKALIEAKGHTVHFVTLSRSFDGAEQWYTLVFEDARFELNNGGSDLPLEGSPRSLMQLYYGSSNKRLRAGVFKTALGSDFPRDWADVCIIISPWAVPHEGRLPCETVLGLVHDVVPNVYALTRPEPPFIHANEHKRGYSYYLRHCDAVLTNSVETSVNFERYFGRSRPIVALPPLLPPSFWNAPLPTGSRSRSLLLAGPLDSRKGLAQLPHFINSIRHEIEELTIFGGIRCREPDAAQFFRSLEVEQVTWYPSIAANTLTRLYSSSKLMLFPSLDEGLGIPILEAQWMGARVAVRDKKPMNVLALEGNLLLDPSPSLAGPADEARRYAQSLATILCDDSFDAVELAVAARRRFDPSQVLGTLARVIPDLVEPRQ